MPNEWLNSFASQPFNNHTPPTPLTTPESALSHMWHHLNTEPRSTFFTHLNQLRNPTAVYLDLAGDDARTQLRTHQWLADRIYDVGIYALQDIATGVMRTLDELEEMLTGNPHVDYEAYGDEIDTSTLGAIIPVSATQAAIVDGQKADNRGAQETADTEDQKSSNSAVDQPPTTDLDSDLVCPICLEPFSKDHQPQLLKCSHIVGADCIGYWINHSAAENSNLCPSCRCEICERRARRPFVTDAERQRQAQLRIRIRIWIARIVDVLTFIRLMFGNLMERHLLCKTVRSLNMQLQHHEIDFSIDITVRVAPGNGDDRGWEIDVRRLEPHEVETESDTEVTEDEMEVDADEDEEMDDEEQSDQDEEWDGEPQWNTVPESEEEIQAREQLIAADTRVYMERVRQFRESEGSAPAGEPGTAQISGATMLHERATRMRAEQTEIREQELVDQQLFGEISDHEARMRMEAEEQEAREQEMLDRQIFGEIADSETRQLRDAEECTSDEMDVDTGAEADDECEDEMKE